MCKFLMFTSLNGQAIVINASYIVHFVASDDYPGCTYIQTIKGDYFVMQPFDQVIVKLGLRD